MTTINLTPKWENLLPALFDIYKQNVIKKNNARSINKHAEEGIKLIEEEFLKMAKAADAYNLIITNK